MEERSASAIVELVLIEEMTTERVMHNEIARRAISILWSLI